MGRIAALLVGVSMVTLAGVGRAETYLLKSGARIYGVAETHPRGEPGPGWMTVRTSYGRVSFRRADLKRKLSQGQKRTTLYIEEARVTSVEGKAFKSADGGESWSRIPWKVAKEDSVEPGEFPPRVRAGEQVKTGPKSAVDLDVGWGVVRLAPESVLTLQMHEGATLKLTQGKMGARLEELPKGRRFRVETPEASMGVEGTTFLVSWGTVSRFAVLNGLATSGERRLEGGQAMEVSADGVVSPQTLTEEDRRFGAVLEEVNALPRISWVQIPAGTFDMGTTVRFPQPAGLKCTPVHEVRVPAFLLGRYEVTERQYEMLLAWLSVHGDTDLWPNGRPAGVPMDYACNARHSISNWFQMGPRDGWSRPDLCVYHVDWRGAHAFAHWIGGRLPSEAEWEYAARGEVSGRTASPWWSSSTREDYAWTARNSGDRPYTLSRASFQAEEQAALKAAGVRPHPVGRKKPNPFGLHDMLGNAYEWVEDTPSEDYLDAPTDGSARVEEGDLQRIFRGGSFWCLSQCDPRWRTRSRYDSGVAGIRVARDLPR